MRKLDDGVREVMQQMRVRVTETSYNHVTTAVGLFRSYAYSQAAFLAMTAIEEMGKARTLQLVQMGAIQDKEPEKIDTGEINDFITSHKLKALRAAASGLSANHGALRRHGRHKEADLNLSSGILFLAKTGNWMDVRGNCIYTDVDLDGKNIEWPGGLVTADEAYYFICMAFEILIEESDAGFGSAIEEFEGESTVTEFETPADFETAILSMLEEFRGKYEQEFDPSQLDFFVPNIDRDHYEEPWKILEEIRQNEVKIDNEKRETLRQVAEEGLEKPEEEKLEELPEGMEYEEYKDYWLEYGLDAAIDTPYFTRDNMHPELRKLYEEVQEYIDYKM